MSRLFCKKKNGGKMEMKLGWEALFHGNLVVINP